MGGEQWSLGLRVPVPPADRPAGPVPPRPEPGRQSTPARGPRATAPGGPPASGRQRSTGPPSEPARPAARQDRARPAKPPSEPAPALPVARVAVDVPLAHLDRPFDYLVTAEQHEQVVPGCRVRVRFAGQLVAGLVLERAEASDHAGALTPLSKAVSSEPVLSPEVAGLARAVADRWAGSLADVLRLAVPPRHARVEAQPDRAGPPPAPRPPDAGSWGRYESGAAFVAALAAGRSPRAVWTALPGVGWPAEIALAVAASLASGRGAVVVLPDARDVDRLDAALTSLLGEGHHVALRADLGPAERYRRFLRARRGAVRAVIGTRAAVYAPVERLGLVAVWDDGDDLHAEPRAPYAHARDVLVLRAARARAAALVGGPVRTAEGQLLLDRGWARPLVAGRAALRAAAPRIEAAGGEHELERDPAARSARLPRVALLAAREALGGGAPVLVQVPRRGYVPGLACDRCRAPARCERCAGPLTLPAAPPRGAPTGASSSAAGPAPTSGPACAWCGRPGADWSCGACAGVRLRASVVGARRTAEELGRAFPGVPVLTSGRDAVLASVGPEPALVVATPGAEPVATGGYGAALLLDGWALLARPDLRATEETVRRWSVAAALVRPAPDGGRVVVMAEGGLPAVQALVRGDPAGVAPRELAERHELGFPPAVRMAALEGEPAALAELLAVAQLPASAERLGPVPLPARRSGPAGRSPAHPGAPEPAGAPGLGLPDEAGERLLLRVPRVDGTALAAALRAAQAQRSARKAVPVRVRLDPQELL